MLINSYSIIEICTYSSENLIKVLKKNKIYVHRIEHIDQFIFHIKIHPRGIKKVLKVYPNAKIIYQNGLFFIINNLLKKKITIIAMVVALVFFTYLNTLIYNINIYGSNTRITNSISLILKKNNISRFKTKPSLNKLEQIKEVILLENAEVENIDCSIVGSTVILKYFLKEKETVLDNENGKYYAKKDGIISYVDVVKGNCLFKHNDYVKKGELIIDDYLHLNDKDIYIGARGKVYAYTWSLVEIKIATKKVDEAEVFSKLLTEARYQVSRNFTDKEYIENENVLAFVHNQEYSYLKIHFTLLENIAILQK